MPDPPDTAERPEWADPKTRLVAVVEDLLSGVRFRVWYSAAEASTAPAGVPLFRRGPQPFLLEDVGSGVLLRQFGAWPEVVDWQERNVIAEGWKMRHLPPKERERIGLPLDAYPPIPQPQSSV